MARENPSWGQERIANELLLKLGLRVSPQTVRKYLPRHLDREGGRRPAVILQDEQYAGGLPVVLVVPLTTARATMRFAGTTLIRPMAKNGLPQTSVALMFQLRAID